MRSTMSAVSARGPSRSSRPSGIWRPCSPAAGGTGGGCRDCVEAQPYDLTVVQAAPATRLPRTRADGPHRSGEPRDVCRRLRCRGSPHAGSDGRAADDRRLPRHDREPALLARIRAGQIGGVILFSENIRSASQLSRLTARLQRAARAAGRPRLLIAADQEGGLVRRLPWAPPKASAEALGTTSKTHVAAVARKAGAALHAAGVNLDLAPVADVPRSQSNFIEAAHRAFATNRYSVATDAAAFSRGLEAGRVEPVLKHFPGVGRAGAVSTDDGLVRIRATRTQIRRCPPSLRRRAPKGAASGRHALDGRISGLLAGAPPAPPAAIARTLPPPRLRLPWFFNDRPTCRLPQLSAEPPARAPWPSEAREPESTCSS